MRLPPGILLIAALAVSVTTGCGARGSSANEIPPNQYDLWALDVESGKLRDLTRTKAAETAPSFSPDGTRIAFEGNEHGPGLYVMDVDGNNVRRIARGHGGAKIVDTGRWRAPQWSPDGKRIAWATASGCGDVECNSWKVWVVAADGSERLEVAEDAGYPTWSPDGKWIAYEGSVDLNGYGRDVFVVSSEGRGRRHLAQGSLPVWSAADWIAYSAKGGLVALRPDGSGARALAQGQVGWNFGWSPDGRRLWFTHDVGHDTELYVAAVDSFDVTRLTRRLGDDHRLAWSPAHDQVTWLHSDVPFRTYTYDWGELMTADSRGGKTKRLTDERVDGVIDLPAWSRDGKTIVLSMRPTDPVPKRPNVAIWKLDVESGDAEALSGLEGDADAPSVSPDGKHIAFYENGDAGTFLWTADGDGGNRVRIAPGNGAPELSAPWPPAWSPDGKTIAFVRDDGCRTALCDAPEIWLAGPEGEGARPLTSGRHPTWSPDGKRLAFDDDVENDPIRSRDEVGLISANGKGRRIIAEGSSPLWSPRGDLIAFISYDRRQALTHLLVSRPDGAEQRVLVRSSGPEADFTWSADGTSLLTVGDDVWWTVGDDVWKLGVTKGTKQRLAATKGRDETPGVSPDGKLLAWVNCPPSSGCAAPKDLYVARSDGSDVRTVTNERQIIVSVPAWSPDRRSLYYVRLRHRIG